MAGTDFSHLTDDEILNGIKTLNIPDYIRTKSYGIDVRETLAQMTEMLMQLAYNQGMSPQQAQDWVSKLNNKMDKNTTDIGLFQLNKTKGLIDETWVTDTFKAQFIENTQGFTVVPKNRSINLAKTTFSKVVSDNLFNINTAKSGFYISDTTGEEVVGSGFWVSDFIPVAPGKTYSKVSGYNFAVYDSSQAFIGGGSGDKMIIPSNAATIRVSFVDSQISSNSARVNEGDVLLKWDPYQEVISNEYTEKHEIKEEDVPKLSAGKLSFIRSGKNLLDVTRSKEGYYLDFGGILTQSPTYSTSDYIPVDPGVSYVPTYQRMVAFYDKNFVFISELIEINQPKNKAVRTPEGSAYMRVTYSTSFKDIMQIERGSVATHFEPYQNVLDGVAISVDDVIGLEGSGESDNLLINLPPKIYGIVGKEINIYFNNIINQKNLLLDFDVTSTLGKQMSDRWTSTPSASGTTPLTVGAFKHFDYVGTGSTSIVVKDVSLKNQTILYFGDSTVNANLVTQRLLDLYSQEDSDLTLLGTRGSGQNLSEGRGGWGADTYRTPTVIYDEPNPFYNEVKQDFDFSYYMSTQGYSELDHFIIQLGINDTFSMTSDEEVETKINQILSDFDFIIADVHNFDPTIKVGVTITIPPNDSQDAFGNAYGNTQTQWRYKRNNAIWSQRLIEHYKEKESQNIYLVPMQHNIDTAKNISDGVHPTAEGYKQMGDSVYYYLKNIG